MRVFSTLFLGPFELGASFFRLLLLLSINHSAQQSAICIAFSCGRNLENANDSPAFIIISCRQLMYRLLLKEAPSKNKK